MRISYLIPIHNEEKLLKESVSKVKAFLTRYPGSEILLIENGSIDQSKAIVEELESSDHGVTIRGFSLQGKGLGLAYKKGIQEVQKVGGSWVVFGAADLPFECTDLESFIRTIENDPKVEVATGSKLHPQSQINRSLLRAFLTRCFWVLRRIILGMKTRDCQGTVFIKYETLKKISPRLDSDNFFLTTELIFHAEKLGLAVLEFPVVYKGDKRKTKVDLVTDSLKMLKQTFRLWRNRP